MFDMTRVYGDLDFCFFARSRMQLGIGLPLIFLSITTASYDGIPPEKTDQASALINAARNTGGSFLQAQQQALQWIGQQVQTQASFLAYMDVFWVLMLVSLVAVPLALALRKVKLGGPAPVAH
jgi:MFS transporter, DHA2 family, multidrug resistance protein